MLAEIVYGLLWGLGLLMGFALIASCFDKICLEPWRQIKREQERQARIDYEYAVRCREAREAKA